MTRKDHLVQLVAAQLSLPCRVTKTSFEDYEESKTVFEFKAEDLVFVIEHATEALVAIEKELGEIRDETGRMRTVGQQQIDAEVAKAVSAERERCASELARVYVDLGALNGPQLTAKEVVSSGVAAIRRGGA